MYNVEKYVGQCLNSILNQTFQDFEVIVVDDCSTDNSVKLVENMAAKFKGRLQLIKRTKNAGGAAIPRNTGINLSRGKYLFFLDGDDIIVNNAFEILYNAAEQTKADVVHVEKYLIPISKDDTINENTKFRLYTFQTPPYVNKISLETNDVDKRIKFFYQKRFLWWACSKLFKRDFLIANDIKFVDIIGAEDMLFTLYCLFCSKNFVRIPDVIYVYRENPNSVMRKNDNLQNYIHKWGSSLRKGIYALNSFMDNIEVNPLTRQLAFDSFFNEIIGTNISKVYINFQPHELNEFLYEEFSDDPKINTILMSYIFNKVNIYRIQLIQAQRQILLLQKELQEKNGK